jgi:hypothetical protein
MSKEKIYVETSLINRIADPLDPDAAVRREQIVSRQSWKTVRRHRDYELVTSKLAFKECSEDYEDIRIVRLRRRVFAGLFIATLFQPDPGTPSRRFSLVPKHPSPGQNSSTRSTSPLRRSSSASISSPGTRPTSQIRTFRKGFIIYLESMVTKRPSSRRRNNSEAGVSKAKRGKSDRRAERVLLTSLRICTRIAEVSRPASTTMLGK